MEKYTLRQLRELIKNGNVTDITDYNFEEIEYLRTNYALKKIGYSQGVHGLNGGLLKDTKTERLFAIVRRSGSLFQLF